MRIGIVGMGWVGSSVAASILHRGLASELLVNDVRTQVAEGEAMDLEHGSLFYPADPYVREASLEEIATRADAVVLAAGRGGTAVESRLAAYEIIRRKGATNHAIGAVTAALLASTLGNERRVLTVSTVQNGPLGLRDVALSLPSVVGHGGAERVLEPGLDEQERELLSARPA